MTRRSRGWFAEALEVEHPAWRAFGGRLDSVMRYGENPHQQAGFYVTGDKRPGVATARQLQGKQLSYNNINDTDAAFELVGEFDPARTAAVAIIKHANPCGVAEGATLKEAYAKALACDPVSAFGGIVAVNRAARRRGRRGDRQDLHRGDHRAGRERGSAGDRRRQEESAAAGHRRPARSARGGHRREVGGRRAAGAGPRQCRGRRPRAEGGDQARADRQPRWPT